MITKDDAYGLGMTIYDCKIQRVRINNTYSSEIEILHVTTGWIITLINTLSYFPVFLFIYSASQKMQVKHMTPCTTLCSNLKDFKKISCLYFSNYVNVSKGKKQRVIAKIDDNNL